MLDLETLRADGIVSEDTLEWFWPQWLAQQREAEELEEESLYFLDFGAGPGAEEGPAAEEVAAAGSGPREHGFSEVELSGKLVRYCCDRSSTAHGNAVWAASIKAALHVGDLLLSGEVDPGSVRILELGAGTGIPSLFAAQVLGDLRDPCCQAPGLARQSQVYISDISTYHNIRQLVLSSSRHPRRDRIRVVPHTWGAGLGCDEPGDGSSGAARGQASFVSRECDGQKFDLLVVSDCIYNPEYQEALLDSMCHALRRPPPGDRAAPRAVVSFSLHPNTDPENVWGFFDKASARGLRVHAEETEDMGGAMGALGLFRLNMGSRHVVHIRELRWRE